MQNLIYLIQEENDLYKQKNTLLSEILSEKSLNAELESFCDISDSSKNLKTDIDLFNSCIRLDLDRFNLHSNLMISPDELNNDLDHLHESLEKTNFVLQSQYPDVK